VGTYSRLPFSKDSRHHCLRFRNECFTFHCHEEEFRVSTQNYRLAVANKNTSKNCESGFCQTKMKHLPTILAVVQQQNLKLNQLLLAANSEE